jgi:hypothetical protein
MNFAQLRTLLDSQRVWTAKQADGTLERGSGTCDDWTSEAGESQTGNSSSTNTLWTDQFVVPCDHPERLYCIEQ